MTVLFSMLGMAFAALVYLCIHYWRLSSRHESKAIAAEDGLARSHQNESALKQQLSELQIQLTHAIEDPLTHLPGRELFADRLRQNLHECDRYQLSMAVLYLDITDFHVITNALGDEVGDRVLQEVAGRLRGCIRQVDTLSRYDQDVFVALLTQLSKPETAAMIAQRMLQTLDQPVQVKDQCVFVTASIGIAVYPADGQEASSLLRSANQALLNAKKNGRQTYQFYQEQFHVNNRREFILASGLMNDSFFQELELYYQPVKDVRSDSLFCMEALARWHHPQLGLIEAEEIFSHADKQGKLNQISEWMLEKACKKYLQWRAQGFEPGLLGVPVAFTQIKNPHFIYKISQMMQELDFKPDWLLLQVREGGDPIAGDVLEKAYNMLDYLQIRLALDDFGAGAISFHHLKHFPVNFLKLHPDLIQDIQNNQRTRELVRALAVMADSLSSPLMIQGVNDADQLLILKELGCYLLMGQYVGEACSETEAFAAQPSL